MAFELLIVDDHPVCRQGLVSLINREHDLHVCGEASDIQEALLLIKDSALSIDLIIIDLSLSSGSDVQLIKAIRAWDETLRILVASMYDEIIFAERVIQAGANGYIDKLEDVPVILNAIRTILSGQLYLSPQMHNHVLCTRLQPHNQHASTAETQLSDREMEVFALIGQGLTTKQIANQLHLSSKTVDTHKEHIKRKLNIANNTLLIQRAVSLLLAGS